MDLHGWIQTAKECVGLTLIGAWIIGCAGIVLAVGLDALEDWQKRKRQDAYRKIMERGVGNGYRKV